jgi:hypothetical protein
LSKLLNPKNVVEQTNGGKAEASCLKKT